MLVKDCMIEVIKEINKKYYIIIVLIIYNMEDIIDLCKCVIILDEGSILYDGLIKKIKVKFGDMRYISFLIKERNIFFELKEMLLKDCLIEEIEGYIYLFFDLEKMSVNDVLKIIVDKYIIEDIKIEENLLESIVKKIYEIK